MYTCSCLWLLIIWSNANASSCKIISDCSCPIIKYSNSACITIAINTACAVACIISITWTAYSIAKFYNYNCLAKGKSISIRCNGDTNRWCCMGCAKINICLGKITYWTQWASTIKAWVIAVKGIHTDRNIIINSIITNLNICSHRPSRSNFQIMSEHCSNRKMALQAAVAYCDCSSCQSKKSCLVASCYCWRWPVWYCIKS